MAPGHTVVINKVPWHWGWDSQDPIQHHQDHHNLGIKMASGLNYLVVLLIMGDKVTASTYVTQIEEWWSEIEIQICSQQMCWLTNPVPLTLTPNLPGIVHVRTTMQCHQKQTNTANSTHVQHETQDNTPCMVRIFYYCYLILGQLPPYQSYLL